MKIKNAFLALALLTMPISVVSCANTEGNAPEIKIGDNGNWFIDGVDTGKPSSGSEVKIGANGNWIINGVDTGKPSHGKNSDIKIGENGNWFIDNEDTGLSSKGDNAYEIFKKLHPDADITEEEWLHHFIKDDLDKFTYQLITFKVDGKVYKEFKVNYGETVPTFDEPTKKGQCFAGWFDENGKKFINNNITDDHTYHARFVSATADNGNDLNFRDVQMPARPTGLNEHNLANNPQDGTILHAWSWGLKEITKEMKNIAAAGYSSVQTSPMQPQKDYYPGNGIKWWWKVYQPLGFEVAKKDNALGTKEDLIELCEEADKYGVKVIVDVVANHLAGGSENTMNPNSQEYEPEIYNNNLFHKHGDGEYCNDSEPYLTTNFPLGGYPDVQTENPKVQRAVLGLLNEYVECGVDGFRFDAAKHIETPYDIEGVASDFWNVAIKGSAKHAMDLGMNVPYSYGEILYSPGNGRSFDSYTNDNKVGISVTDNTAANQALEAVKNRNAYPISRTNVFNTDIPGNKAVLWGESHDTYANDDRQTTDIPQNMVNKAYAINASRKDATSLYFIRPHEFSDAPNAMRLGGKSYNQHWKSKAITEVNKFHNAMINATEAIGTDDSNYFANYKKIDGKYAAMIVNLTDNNKLTNYNALENLGEGTYRDAVSNNLFTVKNGFLSGEFDSSGIACLYQEGKVTAPQPAPVPRISTTNDGARWNFEPITFTINETNADESWYTIDEGERVNFDKTTEITLGDDGLPGEHKVTVHANNQFKQVTTEYTYMFETAKENQVIALDVPREIWDGRRVLAYTWNLNGFTEFVDGKLWKNDFLYEIDPQATHFMLVTLPFDVPNDWSYAQLKTDPGVEIVKEQKSYTLSNWVPA